MGIYFFSKIPIQFGIQHNPLFILAHIYSLLIIVIHINLKYSLNKMLTTYFMQIVHKSAKHLISLIFKSESVDILNFWYLQYIPI